MDVKVSEVAKLPTKYGEFKIQCFAQGCKEHLVMMKEPLGAAPVVRVHSECLTGDALGSQKCDCGEQLDYALRYIAKHGGMLIYLRQEGRNIGLLNKVNAYALQDRGYDTISANHQLGFAADERTYEMVEFILDFYGIDKIKLLTNNPNKIESLKGVEIIERIPIKVSPNPHNEEYLRIKKEKMGHLLD